MDVAAESSDGVNGTGCDRRVSAVVAAASRCRPGMSLRVKTAIIARLALAVSRSCADSRAWQQLSPGPRMSIYCPGRPGASVGCPARISLKEREQVWVNRRRATLR